MDSFLEQKAAAVSPLQKVAFFEQALEWTDQLQQIQAALRTRQGEIHGQLQSLNLDWAQVPPPGCVERMDALPLDRLERLYRELSYLTRWMGQVSERMVRLAC